MARRSGPAIFRPTIAQRMTVVEMPNVITEENPMVGGGACGSKSRLQAAFRGRNVPKYLINGRTLVVPALIILSFIPFCFAIPFEVRSCSITDCLV
jgi:hypothetical protein